MWKFKPGDRVTMGHVQGTVIRGEEESGWLSVKWDEAQHPQSIQSFWIEHEIDSWFEYVS